MSRDPQIPPVGEEIHLPGGSIQPLLLTIGITAALVGVTTTWWLTIAGGILALWTIIRWIADTRSDIAELPLHHDHGHAPTTGGEQGGH
jgi:type IV secretory pathway TrbD component